MSRRVAFVYSDVLSRHVLREDHPLRATRLCHTYELLDSYGAFGLEDSTVLSPRYATEEELLTFQTKEYVEAVKSFSCGEDVYSPEKYNFSPEGDNPIFDGMYEAALLSSGASLVAAELVAENVIDVAFNVAGGLHHAGSGYASGFCVFNDPAIAIHSLLRRGLKVAYVDIDAHHGDGVQDAFYHTGEVLTISLHESGKFIFPGTGFVGDMGVDAGRGYSVNMPLHPYTVDEIYVEVFREVVPPLIEAFRPDVLVTQLGIDSHYKDPLSHLALTSRGYVDVIEEFVSMGIPWLALGGGGYDLSAVARCWTLAYGSMLGQQWDDDIPMSYQERYGVKRLRDSGVATISNSVIEDARCFARENVQQIKTSIFPLHGLR